MCACAQVSAIVLLLCVDLHITFSPVSGCMFSLRHWITMFSHIMIHV